MYLLNKDIEQLMHHCGLTASNLRATLPNLREMLLSALRWVRGARRAPLRGAQPPRAAAAWRA